MTNPLKAVEELGEEMVKGFKKLSRLHFPVPKSETPLKRSKTGFEVEMYVLDEEGRPTNTDGLIRAAKKKGIPVAKEPPDSVIEVLCLPHHHHRSTSRWMLNHLMELSELAEKQGLSLYPYGTYPGEFDLKVRRNDRYDTIRKVWGEDRVRKGFLGTGYHQHYTLPRGLFNPARKRLEYKTSSKVRRTLLDSHNFLVAADPAITTLLQSSPFAEGKHIAKDTRMLFFRDGHPFQYKDAIYYNEPIFGQLPEYKHTLHDLIDENEQRIKRWKELVKDTKDARKIMHYTKDLSYNWGPIKINPKGTLEYRGPDMNLMSNVFAASTMIKFALRRIQQDFMLVTPIDMKLEDAFKVEGNMLFIPPHSVVRKELQKESAYEGLTSERMRMYTRRFFRFCRDEIKRFDPDYLPLLKPAQTILDKNETVSDRILKQAKRQGHKTKISQSFARTLALKEAKMFSKDLGNASERLSRTNEDL